jgi:peptidoglycan/LPS O-acetylase OafA/YrhL
MVGHAVWHLDVHTQQWVYKIIFAFPGIPIFFVTSGFLISASYERTTDIRNYALNRILRIYPGLWCCLIVTVGFYAILGLSFVNRQAPVWFLSQLVGLIYTPQFMKHFGFGSYNGSLWSIPVELQFYMLLPVVYWVCRPTRRWEPRLTALWATFVCIALAYNMLVPPLDDPQNANTLQKLFGYTFIPHFYLFLTGVLLQRINAFGSRWISGKGLYWAVVYLSVLYLVPSSSFSYIASNILLAVTTISVAYTSPTLAHTLLRGTDVSYGVYIYHALLVNAFVVVGLKGHASYVIVLSACVYVVAYLSWIGVEKPCLRRKKQTISPELAIVTGKT